MLGTKTIAFDTNFFGLLILCFFYNWKQFWEVGVGIYLEQKVILRWCFVGFFAVTNMDNFPETGTVFAANYLLSRPTQD